jgi:hypothetical protein
VIDFRRYYKYVRYLLYWRSTHCESVIHAQSTRFVVVERHAGTLTQLTTNLNPLTDS